MYLCEDNVLVSESENLTYNLPDKLLRTDIFIIRSYRVFLILLPLHMRPKEYLQYHCLVWCS
ncbi:hypothetical protein D9597_21465 [Escherichia sp. E13S3]|nr:hypothetical protein D9597_21465 [Escherichia sp. E13S3]